MRPGTRPLAEITDAGKTDAHKVGACQSMLQIIKQALASTVTSRSDLHNIKKDLKDLAELVDQWAKEI